MTAAPTRFLDLSVDFFFILSGSGGSWYDPYLEIKTLDDLGYLSCNPCGLVQAWHPASERIGLFGLSPDQHSIRSGFTWAILCS